MTKKELLRRIQERCPLISTLTDNDGRSMELRLTHRYDHNAIVPNPFMLFYYGNGGFDIYTLWQMDTDAAAAALSLDAR